MTVSSPSTPLAAFQSRAGKDDLLAHVRSIDASEQGYAAAFDALEPVLRPLFFAFQPDLDALDPSLLRQHEPETVDILVWLADSPKADLETAALAIMGVLGWEAFLPHLERALQATESWERIAAIQALARHASKRVATLLLRSLAKDPDPAVRAAVAQALERRTEKGGA